MTLIQWPCLFKLDGDDELLYLESETALVAEFEALIWSDEDILIDSNGIGFCVQVDASGEFTYQAQSAAYTLEQVTELIQAHEFAKVEVCLTKIQFQSVEQAIASLAFDY